MVHVFVTWFSQLLGWPESDRILSKSETNVCELALIHLFCHKIQTSRLTSKINNMKFTTISLLALFSGASAFNSFQAKPVSKTQIKTSSLSIDTLPGALPPFGVFDPLGFADKADANTLKRYREAELTHGRVSMLAVLGFLVGEKVEGSSFLFDASIKGPAITHLPQVPSVFWVLLTLFIGSAETGRAQRAFVEPSNVPVDQAGLMRESYVNGDLGFDPLNLKPEDPAAFLDLQNKELNNGRLAMIAAAGFLAQEAVNGKGILENLFG